MLCPCVSWWCVLRRVPTAPLLHSYRVTSRVQSYSRDAIDHSLNTACHQQHALPTTQPVSNPSPGPHLVNAAVAPSGMDTHPITTLLSRVPMAAAPRSTSPPSPLPCYHSRVSRPRRSACRPLGTLRKSGRATVGRTLTSGWLHQSAHRQPVHHPPERPPRHRAPCSKASCITHSGSILSRRRRPTVRRAGATRMARRPAVAAVTPCVAPRRSQSGAVNRRRSRPWSLGRRQRVRGMTTASTRTSTTTERPPTQCTLGTMSARGGLPSPYSHTRLSCRPGRTRSRWQSVRTAPAFARSH